MNSERKTTCLFDNIWLNIKHLKFVFSQVTSLPTAITLPALDTKPSGMLGLLQGRAGKGLVVRHLGNTFSSWSVFLIIFILYYQRIQGQNRNN